MYTALYRKFRPALFSDVKGQDAIVTTLKNQIKADRIGHAYLFCGTRGTGKTSVAKIFARAVNCENPKDGEPCGECAVCRAITEGNALNVIEMDAASNNGVETIRQIREEVGYSPAEGRFTVYIVDEVHMLSESAFNALLKTLEEPPSYVIFILATTEVRKIPDTILSRCQRYDFRRIPVATIASRLKELLDKEGIRAEEKAVNYIARMADGSMRDGISLLDQAIAFYLGEELTYDRVLSALGASDSELFAGLYEAVLKEDVYGALKLVDGVVLHGSDLSLFVNDFCLYLRNLLLVKSVGDPEGIVDLSSEAMAVLKTQAEASSVNSLMRCIRICSELSSSLRYSAQKRILTEVALIRLIKSETETDTASLLERVEKLEKKLEEGVPARVTEPAPAYAPRSAPVEKKISPEKKKELLPAIPDDIRALILDWGELVDSLAAGYPVRNGFAGARLSLSNQNKLRILIDDEIRYGLCTTPEALELVEKACEERAGRRVELEVVPGNRDGGREEPDLRELLSEMINMEIEEE